MSTAPGDSAYPVGVDGFFQPRRAAFWLLVAFLALGLYTLVTMFGPGLRVVPMAFFLGTTAWVLYTLPILLFFRRLDLFEELPWSGFALAFAWGGMGAVALALPANQAVQGLCAKLISPEFCAKWGPAMAGPTDEEPLKLLGVCLLVLVARNQFRTISSVMAVGAMVGLGFQVVEDLSYTVIGALNHVSPDEVQPVVTMLVVRGFICGLWSHTAYTAVASFGVGYFVTRQHEPLGKRLVVAAGAFVFAWSMHFLWNSPLLVSGGGSNATAILVLPLKGLPIVLAAILLWRVAQREERAHLAALAAHFVSPDLITADERAALGKIGRRRALRRALAKSHGRAAARLLARLQKIQLRLVRHTAEVGPTADTTHTALADEIRALRANLAAHSGAGKNR